MARIKWGAKKSRSHLKNRRADRAEKRAIEKRDRQKAKRELRREREEA